MTTNELKVLWHYLKNWGMKYQVLFGFCCFRGLRISEATAINIYDFKNDNFDLLTYRSAKTNKVISDKPIIKPFADFVKQYIFLNKHLLRNGFLFPHHNSINKRPHISPGAVQAAFSKIRQDIGKKYPEFLDKYHYPLRRGGKYVYRIGTHSLRRWFITNLALIHRDPYLIKEIMNYSELQTISHYVSGYEFHKREPKVLEQTFGSLFNNINLIPPSQKKLIDF